MAGDSKRPPLVFDIECAPLPDAAEYLDLDEIQAPSNYKDQAKIDAYVAEKRAEAVSKAALDVDLARIVALGVLEAPGTPQDTTGDVWLCRTEDDERNALETFWEHLRPYPYPPLICFNGCGYDLPMLLRRSLYLGLVTPPIQIGRYKHPDVIDLMLLLSFDGALKFRSLSFFCRRFGIPVPDGKGSEIPALVAAGDWSAVERHCRADLQATAALAARMGLWA